MKTLLCAIFVGFLALPSCGQSETIKTLSELTEVEKRGLDYIVFEVYKKVSPSENASICPLIYETTYNVMPREDGSYGEKLEEPIVLLSGACIGPHMLLPETLASIREEIKYARVIWTDNGREIHLRILDAYLVPNPGGAGGTFGSSNDMVTIVPTKIEVK